MNSVRAAACMDADTHSTTSYSLSPCTQAAGREARGRRASQGRQGSIYRTGGGRGEERRFFLYKGEYGEAGSKIPEHIARWSKRIVEDDAYI